MPGTRQPSAKYIERVQALLRAVEIAITLQSTEPDSVRWLNQQKDFLLTGRLHDGSIWPLRTLESLRYTEDAILTYWNEAAGPHIERFWQLIAEEQLPFVRRDILGDVLRRGHIRGMSEYETVVDSIVIWEQQGQITRDQATQLAAMLAKYETRHSGRRRT